MLSAPQVGGLPGLGLSEGDPASFPLTCSEKSIMKDHCRCRDDCKACSNKPGQYSSTSSDLEVVIKPLSSLIILGCEILLRIDSSVLAECLEDKMDE